MVGFAQGGYGDPQVMQSLQFRHSPLMVNMRARGTQLYRALKIYRTRWYLEIAGRKGCQGGGLFQGSRLSDPRTSPMP
jgi:hypothetical protein